VTLFDVLEHLPKPAFFFEDIHRVLKQGGFVMAYLPNIHSFAYRLMGNQQNTLYPFEHVGFYDQRSLNYLASKTGFLVHSLEYFGLDVMDYFCMKSYEDNFDYLEKLTDFIPLAQAVIDKQGIANHQSVVFKKM
jgi:predicted SAM-dependent methyltransferase